MTDPRSVTFYLEDGLRQNAEAGKHNFISHLVSVLRGAGYHVDFRADSVAERALSLSREGRAMFHMQQPTTARGLTFRRVYHYPFWQIERVAARWDWDTAHAEFTGPGDRDEADRFYAFWQKRLFGDRPARARRSGFVFVPLQGMLRDHRSFQFCSPLDMVRAVLEHETEREILVTLHPGERYDEDDLAALEAMEHPRLKIAIGGMEEALTGCDYVVTQNSSAAFNGYFFGKPAILFAGIDFHHIAANVAAFGIEGAFEAVHEMHPDYAGYVWWFWQHMSINAGRPDAERQIRDRLDALGWPV